MFISPQKFSHKTTFESLDKIKTDLSDNKPRNFEHNRDNR